MNRAEALTEFGRFCLRQSAEALELLVEKTEEDGMTSLSTDNLRTVADVWRDQTPDMKDINNIIQGLGFVSKRKYEDLKKENENLNQFVNVLTELVAELEVKIEEQRELLDGYRYALSLYMEDQ